MMSYDMFPNLRSAPSIGGQGPLPEAPPQVGYHLKVVQAGRRGLIDKERIFKKKYKKYNRILNRLTCFSGISIATGISSVVTFATLIRIPVSAALSAASMTRAIASGIISMITEKYEQKLKKVMCFIDIIDHI